MANKDELRISQGRLEDAWRRTLPIVMNKTDQCEVMSDGADDKALRIHIKTAGHQMYAFDFKVTYEDSREIRVELVDVERDGKTIDERPDAVQRLIEDYTRHLHECAQQLHDLTKA
ncbi:hypothetical protein [Paenibacillus tarimensis]|uniref:hypothetical protein n=1 Tax=Paenibacillus tarimensis TaxID=416012 RepID=UPI001F36A32B|nr:hypothetical protein [Paenibacillus tarimensis]MCF2945902.1 hypothetical protein [Paenibacillus tarimensis]